MREGAYDMHAMYFCHHFPALSRDTQCIVQGLDILRR